MFPAMRWPLLLAVPMVVVYVAFMVLWANGVHWVVYDWLPRETAVGLGGLVCGGLVGETIGERIGARRYDSSVPSPWQAAVLWMTNWARFARHPLRATNGQWIVAIFRYWYLVVLPCLIIFGWLIPSTIRALMGFRE